MKELHEQIPVICVFAMLVVCCVAGQFPDVECETVIQRHSSVYGNYQLHATAASECQPSTTAKECHIPWFVL